MSDLARQGGAGPAAAGAQGNGTEAGRDDGAGAVPAEWDGNGGEPAEPEDRDVGAPAGREGDVGAPAGREGDVRAPAGRGDGGEAAPASPSADESEYARYHAARAFLIAEWVGALLMALSFIQFSVLLIGPYDVAPPVLLGLAAALLLLGSLVFWRSRTYYLRLEVPWRPRLHAAAAVVAGSGLFFWALFVFLAYLVWRGVEIL